MSKHREPEILNANDYDQLIAALRGLESVPAIMTKAKSCGVNCDEYEKMHNYSREAIEHLLKTWFPRGRPK